MYKVIDLGFEVPETGEKRVTLLEGVLTKVASSEIQRYWDELERKADSAYLWVIGVSAMEYYGCNNNGDSFSEVDLKASHASFVDNAHVYLHHVNKDPKKSIGRPIFSFYNDVMHRVELIMELSKSNIMAADTITKLKRGDDIYVSMGCNVSYDVCSICSNKAKTRAEYCEHLRYNLKKILPDGRQVYALNPNPKFFDISIVRKPADPMAFTLDKVASDGGASCEPFVTSAELGERVVQRAEKLAALQKLSDIIKEVEGCITDVKDDSDDTNILRQVARRGFKDIEYPDMDVESLIANNVPPLGYAKAILDEGAPLTFGDALYIGGRHCFGNDLRRQHLGGILSILPGIINILRHSDIDAGGIVRDLFSHGDYSIPSEVTIKIIRPVAQARTFLLRKVASDIEFEKVAVEIPNITVPHTTGNMKDIGKYEAIFSQNVPGNLRPITIVGNDGKTYTTNLGEVRNNALWHTTGTLGKKAIGAALLTVALTTLLSDPDKARSLAGAIISGALGASLFSSEHKTVSTDQVAKVPATAAFHKSAATALKPITTKVPKMVYAGMAIPAALSLDYLYNKLKYKDEDPTWYLSSTGKALHGAGEFVTQNPVVSTLAGGVAGSALRHLLLKKGLI